MPIPELESPKQRIGKTQQRVLDAIREIGELIMAFAPLDGVIQKDVAVITVIGLFIVGFCAFLLSVLIERRLENVN